MTTKIPSDQLSTGMKKDEVDAIYKGIKWKSKNYSVPKTKTIGSNK